MIYIYIYDDNIVVFLIQCNRQPIKEGGLVSGKVRAALGANVEPMSKGASAQCGQPSWG